MARLNVNGSLDNGFNAGRGPRNGSGTIMEPKVVTILPDSSIGMGGAFKVSVGKAREGFVLIRGDQTPSDFAPWLAAQDLTTSSDPASDDDGDRLELALEFAYDLNPHVPDSLLMQASGNGVASLRPPSHRELTVTGSFSSTMESWIPVPINALGPSIHRSVAALMVESSALV